MTTTVELIFVSFACVAILATAFVLVSHLIVIFRSPSRFQTDPFLHTGFWVTVCFLMVFIGGSFGFPPSNSNLCKAQGFINSFFLLSGAGWLAVMFFTLYKAAEMGNKIDSLFAMHAFSWSAGSIAAFVPLGELSYGRAAFVFDDGFGFCTFESASRKSYAEWVTIIQLFESVAFFSLFAFVGMKMYLKFGLIGGPMRAVFAWAVIFVVFWGPYCVYAFLIDFGAISNSGQSMQVMPLLYAYAFLVSPFTVAIFVRNNHEIRQLWISLVFEGTLPAPLLDTSSNGYSSYPSSNLHSRNSGRSMISMVSQTSIQSQLSRNYSKDSADNDVRLSTIQEVSMTDAALMSAWNEHQQPEK